MTTPDTTRPAPGTGIFTVPDAVRLFGVISEGTGPSPARVRRWIAGYRREATRRHPAGVLPTWRIDDGLGFSFYTLVEAFVVGQLRELGVSMQAIRKAREDLADRLASRHLFATEGLLSDGKKILYEVDEEGLLRLDKTGILEFNKLMADFYTRIEFDTETKLAARIRPLGPGTTVVVDPHHAFGNPVIEGTNIPTETIASLVLAGESPEVVAGLYGLNVHEVTEAVEFERRLAA